MVSCQCCARSDIEKPPRSFRNIYDDTEKPPVIVDNINETSFKLTDGVILPCNAIFHNGVAFMWDTPPAAFGWQGWNKEMFEIFEFTSPKPGTFISLHAQYEQDKRLEDF
jgi:hypothetical protein